MPIDLVAEGVKVDGGDARGVAVLIEKLPGGV